MTTSKKIKLFLLRFNLYFTLLFSHSSIFKCFDSRSNVLIGQLVFFYTQDLFSFLFVLVDISCVCCVFQDRNASYVLIFFLTCKFFKQYYMKKHILSSRKG